MTELADDIAVTNQNAATTLNRLTKVGWVTRAKPEPAGDRRKTFYAIADPFIRELIRLRDTRQLGRGMNDLDRARLRQSATALVARLRARGMTLSEQAAESFLAHHLKENIRAAKPNLNEATLDALADDLVKDFAAEQPGANLFDLPRTATLSVATFGRLIAGLAETLSSFTPTPRSPTPIGTPDCTRPRSCSQWLDSCRPTTPTARSPHHPRCSRGLRAPSPPPPS